MTLLDFLSNLKTLIGDNNSFHLESLIKVTHQTINIGDISKASPEQLKILKSEIAPEIRKAIESSEDGHLLEASGVDADLNLIQNFSKDSENLKLIDFVTNSLPKKDSSIWYTALMLKAQDDAGNTEQALTLRFQIVDSAGQRGANIANLCNEGYLESHIKPLYEHLVDGEKNEKEFFDQYELIVEDLIFAVFCSRRDTPESLSKQITEKIKRVKMYGWNRVHIHAIGSSNVITVNKAMTDVEKNCKNIKNIKTNSDSKHISIIILLN